MAIEMISHRKTLTTILVNFNHARYLGESLGSILTQSRPSDELIVIDDKSTDNSVEVIQSLLPRHSNARLIKNPVNQGCFANVNDGLQLARGDYVHLASADDIFYPALYQTGMKLLEACSSSVFSSRSDIVDEAGHNLNKPTPWAGYPLKTPGLLTSTEVRQFLMDEDGWFMGNTALFRRPDVLEQGGFPIELQSFADGYMCRFLALRDGACFSPDVLAAWRQVEGGFAASVSASLEKTKLLIAAAEQKMRAAPQVFPASYIKRWKGRQEFDVRRRALARERAESAASGFAGRAIAALREKLRAGILLLELRPWDLISNIRQRLALYRGRI
jgi:hypothetical protein